MKTNIFIHTAVIFAALSCLFGCTNPEIEIRKGIEIQIRPSTILSGFTPLKSDNFEMRSDSHLRITCLIYDGNGKLAYQEQTLLGNFNQDITFHTTLNEGTYTVVALATCIQGTLSAPTDEAYSISGTESLKQLRIEQQTMSGFSYTSTWSMIGYAYQSVSFDDSQVILNMKPATSLVYMYWKNIHAHDNDATTVVYSKYSTKAIDYWGKNEYSWTITIEKDGNSSTDVIVKDLSPYLHKKGFTSDKGCNIFKGKIEGNTLTIASGQNTGVSDNNVPIRLYGIKDDNITDISFRIDKRKLVTTTTFGVYVSGENHGWYDFFNPDVVFTKESPADIVFTNGSSDGIDSYGIIYHSNDIMKFDDNGSPIYSTSLSSTENNGTWVSPEDFTTTNVYGLHNLFPGKSIRLFARTFSGNTRDDYSVQTFTLNSGHQYVFDLDCAAFKLTPYEGILGTRSSNDDYSTYEDRPQACHQLDPIKNN